MTSSRRKINGLRRFGTLLSVGLLLGTSAACSLRQGMYDQAKYKPNAKSEFFPDDRANRLPVEGTVARGELREDDLFYRGEINGKVADVMPFPATKAVLQRGQERFNIYCTVCHAHTGRGDGMVVRRGFHPPPSLHEARIRNAPIGHFFQVISQGYGAMPDYSTQVEPRDRWAIAAYIRALQLSEHATVDDVPPAEREKLR